MPKLRFPGFEGEWTRNRLDEVASVNPASPEIPLHFYYIDLESVDAGILSEIKEITKSDAPSRAQREVRINDILFQTVRPYQKNNYFMQEEFGLPVFASTGYAQIRTENNPYFLYSLLHTKRFLNNVLLRCTGSSYPAINSNDLKEIEIYTPCQLEQSKLSLFMSLIDKRIEKQKQLIETVKKYKRGVIRTLLTPEYCKFKDAKWTSARIGDLGSFIKGAPLSKADIADEGTPFILYGELYTTYNEVITQIVRKTKANVEQQYFSQIGDVIIPTSGETPEEISTASCVMVPGVILGGDLNIFRCSKVDGRIISYILNHVVSRNIARIAQGKSVVHVQANELAKIEIAYPDFKTQENMVTLFEAINAKIAQRTKELELLLEQRRALLQQVFI